MLLRTSSWVLPGISLRTLPRDRSEFPTSTPLGSILNIPEITLNLQSPKFNLSEITLEFFLACNYSKTLPRDFIQKTFFNFSQNIFQCAFADFFRISLDSSFRIHLKIALNCSNNFSRNSSEDACMKLCEDSSTVKLPLGFSQEFVRESHRKYFQEFFFKISKIFFLQKLVLQRIFQKIYSPRISLRISLRNLPEFPIFF